METKNSNRWLILAIVFGVLIPIPMLIPPIYNYFVLYVLIVSQLYSWIILPKVEQWRRFVVFVPFLLAIAPIVVGIIFTGANENPLSPSIWILMLIRYISFSYFFFFIPCIRLIQNQDLRNSVRRVFVVLTIIAVIPTLISLLGIVFWNLAWGKWVWTLNPLDWNWQWLLPPFNV